MSNPQTILTDLKDQQLTITLNRPDLRNAFNAQLISELTQVFKTEALNPQVRVVILQGAGKAFSAGGDLNWMKESINYTREQNIADAEKLSTLLTTINECPKPVVAKVHGAALGGGMGLVSVCDIVVSTKECQFGFTEARLGLIPAVIGPFVLAKIGESQARALFLTAERFTAPMAKQLGLIHQIAETESDLDQSIQKIVADLLAGSPAAQKTIKDYLHRIKGRPLVEQNKIASETLAMVRVSDEAQEGIKAFLEKRKPGWVQ